MLSAIKIGVKGYILKDESNKIFLKAIRKVAGGQYYFSGDISHFILSNLNSMIDSKAGNSVAVSNESRFHLSKREKEVLSAIRQGQSNKDIAESFKVSIRTIETHRLNIMRKLRVSNIEECIKIAESEGLI